MFVATARVVAAVVAGAGLFVLPEGLRVELRVLQPVRLRSLNCRHRRHHRRAMAPARAAAAATAPVAVIASVAVVLQSDDYDVSCLTFADVVLVAFWISLIISVREASLSKQNLVMGLQIIQRTDVLRLSAVRMV